MNNKGVGIETFSTLSVFHWGTDKFKNWKGSERNFEPVMRRFINLNKKNLDFLGIKASLESINDKPVVEFVTSHYIGAIPIISPLTGLPVFNLEIKGRYGEDVISLIPLLSDFIIPEFAFDSKLLGETSITPPIFFECCKFIEKYIQAEKSHWRKFDNIIKIEKHPANSTLWKDYALNVATNPALFNRFKNRKNVLSVDHDEWAKLNYVLKISIDTLNGFNVPIRLKILYNDLIQKLTIKLHDKRIIPSQKLIIHASDPRNIKELKSLANIILDNNSEENFSWRLNFTEFFERFVQYLFSDIAKKKGAQIFNNPKYDISGANNISWTLNYLEPDIVVQKGSDQFIIDAKYKSHMYNWRETNEDLKEVFRQDLHQILAYSAFSPKKDKRAILVYPYSDFTCKSIKIFSPISRLSSTVLLLGIPLQFDKLESIKTHLSSTLDFNQLGL